MQKYHYLACLLSLSDISLPILTKLGNNNRHCGDYIEPARKRLDKKQSNVNKAQEAQIS